MNFREPKATLVLQELRLIGRKAIRDSGIHRKWVWILAEATVSSKLRWQISDLPEAADKMHLDITEDFVGWVSEIMGVEDIKSIRGKCFSISYFSADRACLREHMSNPWRSMKIYEGLCRALEIVFFNSWGQEVAQHGFLSFLGLEGFFCLFFLLLLLFFNLDFKEVLKRTMIFEICKRER